MKKKYTKQQLNYAYYKGFEKAELLMMDFLAKKITLQEVRDLNTMYLNPARAAEFIA